MSELEAIKKIHILKDKEKNKSEHRLIGIWYTVKHINIYINHTAKGDSRD